jgi:hypothetical protein
LRRRPVVSSPALMSATRRSAQLDLARPSVRYEQPLHDSRNTISVTSNL